MEKINLAKFNTLENKEMKMILGGDEGPCGTDCTTNTTSPDGCKDQKVQSWDDAGHLISSKMVHLA